jgi:hypothetical protein
MRMGGGIFRRALGMVGLSWNGSQREMAEKANGSSVQDDEDEGSVHRRMDDDSDSDTDETTSAATEDEAENDDILDEPYPAEVLRRRWARDLDDQLMELQRPPIQDLEELFKDAPEIPVCVKEPDESQLDR